MERGEEQPSFEEDGRKWTGSCKNQMLFYGWGQGSTLHEWICKRGYGAQGEVVKAISERKNIERMIAKKETSNRHRGLRRGNSGLAKALAGRGKAC